MCSARGSNPKSPKGLKYYPRTTDELLQLARDNSLYLGDIDTSKITDMSFLFANTPKFGGSELGGFTENMLKAYEHPPREDFRGIELWDVSHVANMMGMFMFAESFNEPLNSWSVSKLTDTS